MAAVTMIVSISVATAGPLPIAATAATEIMTARTDLMSRAPVSVAVVR